LGIGGASPVVNVGSDFVNSGLKLEGVLSSDGCEGVDFSAGVVMEFHPIFFRQ
jgi:hypothetical protein